MASRDRNPPPPQAQGRLMGGAGDATPQQDHPEKKKWQLFGGFYRGAVSRTDGSTKLKPEVKQEWTEVQDEVKRFQQSFDAGTLEPSQAAGVITTSHWVKSSDSSQCSNTACLRALWAMSKHHCRKCGKIFCAKCLQYKRRLSATADYDPNGWPCKVCETCFGAKVQERGHSRRWTYDLMLFRNAAPWQENCIMARADIQRVCKNLVRGFQANHTSSSTPATPLPSSPPSANGGTTPSRSPFTFFKRGVSKVVGKSVPDWQKPPTWVSEGLSCECCDRPYGKLESRRNCHICGRLVCKAQSTKDLLLYTPDKADRAELGAEPRWAIIRVIGCPEVEPDHRLYLRVCHPCKEKLQDIQVGELELLAAEKRPPNVCMRELMAVYSDITSIQAKIEGSMPEFQKLIDGLEIQVGAPSSLPPNRNNMQLLAKHQGDLSDHLSDFVMTVARLKKLSPHTKIQVTLVRNLLTCKVRYYTETNNLYRQLRRQLEGITPQEVLQEIQSIVDSKAINSSCLSLNQLAFECLHLCLKHSLDQTLPLRIKQTAEVCECDLKKKVESMREDWAEHKNQMTVFVRTQIKGDPEAGVKPRPYLRPSRRRTKMQGDLYVELFLDQRVAEVVDKVWAQLVSRTADRSFKGTKQALDKLRKSFLDVEEGSEGALR